MQDRSSNKVARNLRAARATLLRCDFVRHLVQRPRVAFGWQARQLFAQNLQSSAQSIARKLGTVVSTAHGAQTVRRSRLSATFHKERLETGVSEERMTTF
jgi:hypothetical protein